jgi:hypothetical protein
MKTTLNIDDRLLERAKQVAARENSTLTALVEDALRARLAKKPKGPNAFRVKLTTVMGTVPPRVDVADRSALLDYLDER